MPRHLLLTRDAFREGVFARDAHRCVVCGGLAVDAHHVLERRLFGDGGYYLDNGVSLCSEHHLAAERTTLSVEEVREAAGITRPVIPEHLYRDVVYDKWGNPCLGQRRMRGELFDDESVQKVLREGGVLGDFTRLVKYPRTWHSPWSQMGKDDRQLADDSPFVGREVVVTAKMDGENTTMYKDHVHARSLDSGPHPTRDWVKGLWARVSYLLDEDMRVCGENLYAVHSVRYDALPSYFMGFSFWTGLECHSWDETVEYFGILGLEHVPVVYRGPYSRAAVESAFSAFDPCGEHEGYVVRLADAFGYGEFRRSVMKYVRPAFRQLVNDSHGHWVSKRIEVNGLAV